MKKVVVFVVFGLFFLCACNVQPLARTAPITISEISIDATSTDDRMASRKQTATSIAATVTEDIRHIRSTVIPYLTSESIKGQEEKTLVAKIQATVRALYPSPTETKVARPSPTTTTFLETFTDWKEARNYIGEEKIVCGFVMGSNFASSSNGLPTFLDLGKRYPDPERLKIIIWGENRKNFPFNPEQHYLAENVCVNGLIEEYRGILQITISDPSQIEIK